MLTTDLQNPPLSPEAVRIPDTEYWNAQIKCQQACPVNTDARGYVRAIANGENERAYLIARGPNPLASICGRVCGAPCEQACRRGSIDAPIAIRALKRFVCERYGPESRADGGVGLIEFLKEAAQRHTPHSNRRDNELLPLLQSLTRGSIPKVEAKSVGIIGSGPAGLAAAHDLALLGFGVTIYEMEPVLAGMLALGIPEYRLPRKVIQAEVAAILALGVEARTETEVGKDVSFTELRERHDSVVVAVGAKRSRALPIPGGDLEGVHGGVEFLRDISLGKKFPVGSRVVVIGGGNVAYDVGRSVLRQISLDTARTAKREGGADSKVTLCSLESLEEMPADDIEIHEGDEEGVVRRNSMGPVEILGKDGKVTGVRFQRCLRVFDENRRFKPEFDAKDITEIPCDTVLVAIGQTFEIGFLDCDDLEMTERGLIRCDPVHGTTSADDVYVAGDLAYGTRLLIHAVASGKAVARAIYQKQTGRSLEAEDLELHFPLPDYHREQAYEKRLRCDLPTASAEERIQSQRMIVERDLTPESARAEAGRCLDCGVNTIFDGSKCVLCGGCVEVCPEQCLRIVPLSDIVGHEKVAQLAEQQGMNADECSAIVKDETACIRCALCAERCPTGAITMERFSFVRGWACGV